MLPLNWLPWQRRFSDGKTNENLMKPSHTRTNPENLVKICTVDYETKRGENWTAKNE